MNTLKEPPSRSSEPASLLRLIIAIEHAPPFSSPPFFDSTSVAALVYARFSLTLNLREID